MKRALIVNSLGVALAHYVAELQATLERGHIQADVVSVPEPSAGTGRFKWVVTSVSNLLPWRRAVRGRSVVISVWPTLGLLDGVLMNLFLGRRAILIVHDPRPLVRAVGYGRASRWFATRTSRVTYVVHSAAARDEMLRLGFRDPDLVLHPMLASERTTERTPSRRVGILGQFKRDRDLDLILDLGAQLRDEFELVIHGRGWPHIEGWRVDDRFVPEDELNDLMRGLAVVVVPYRRFYQSGVAIRAMENQVPVVGPVNSSLADLCGSDYPWLPSGDEGSEWAECIRGAAGVGSTEIASLRDGYMTRADSTWRALLENRL